MTKDKKLIPRAIARLEAAGRLLQGDPSNRIQIKVQAGETCATAALRVINSLDAPKRAHLQSLVDWVEDYGFDDGKHQITQVHSPRARSNVEPIAKTKGKAIGLSALAAMSDAPLINEDLSLLNNEPNHQQLEENEIYHESLENNGVGLSSESRIRE